MEFNLSRDDREILGRVRSFIEDKVKPWEPKLLGTMTTIDAHIPREDLLALQREAREHGLWGVSTPVSHGGMGVSLLTQALIHTEYGRTFVPFEFGGKADNILFQCSDEQAEEYLRPTLEGERISCFAITEPGAGSDARAIVGTAVRHGDGDWVINTHKKFIGFGHDADYCIVFVRAIQDGNDEGITCFVVDRNAGWESKLVPAMGERRIAELLFKDVSVPDSARLGPVGGGFQLAMQWIGNGRVLIPARVVGTAQRLIEMAQERLTTREVFGRPLSDYQGLTFQLADCVVELEQSKWVTYFAAWKGSLGQDARFDASVAKLSATEMANRVVDRVMQMHGALGYTKELPIERWYRDLRFTRIYEGTDEIQRRTIAREIVKGRYVADNLVQLGGTDRA